ncbi:MAG: DNA polymerase III subunit gamma/tau [Spirochaetaceae bacterium]|nr:DNA polymerase III subunit gamma/tau [Spirochaetaceae bacterium]
MAYEVTATRRRPQRFEDLVGQEFVAATLRNSIQAGKIAHAYLFAGPRGCGKTSSARILAKALNCQHGPSATPCGQCTTCQEITRGSSLDVIEIDGASNTSVNDIRQIKDEILFPPNSCRYKIYIIDEVHMLSTSAFNALLKTIEEPPPYVIFVFATTELHKVPATIKSRCQQFNFRLVAVEQLKMLLTQAATEINVQADDEALYWIAREATGSVRDAYTLFDQVTSFSEGHITYDKIRNKLGLVGVEKLNELCEICCQGNAKDALDTFDNLLQGGISIEQFISNLTDYLRSLLLIKSGVTKEALLGQSAERFSAVVLENWSVPQIEQALSLVLNLYRDIRYSLNPRYEADLAVSRLCGVSTYISLQEVKQAVEQARALLLGTSPLQNQELQRQQGEDRYPLSNGGAVPPEHRQLDNKNDYSTSEGKQIFQQILSATPKNQQVAENQLNQSANNTQNIVTSQKDDFAQVSLENLREAMIKELSLTHVLAASALMDSEPWDFSEKGIIQVALPSAFALSQLQKEQSMLSQLASSLAKQNLTFRPILQHIETNEQLPQYSPQVEIVCKMFKGSVVGVNK